MHERAVAAPPHDADAAAAAAAAGTSGADACAADAARASATSTASHATRVATPLPSFAIREWTQESTGRRYCLTDTLAIWRLSVKTRGEGLEWYGPIHGGDRPAELVRLWEEMIQSKDERRRARISKKDINDERSQIVDPAEDARSDVSGHDGSAKADRDGVPTLPVPGTNGGSSRSSRAKAESEKEKMGVLRPLRPKKKKKNRDKRNKKK